MDTLDQLLSRLSRLPLNELRDLVTEGAVEAYKYMQRYFGYKANGLLYHVILCAMAVDGSLATYEYEVTRPALEWVTGRSLSVNDVKNMINANKSGYSSTLSEAAATMRDLRNFDKDAFNALATMCAGILAADGINSPDENYWLREFFD